MLDPLRTALRVGANALSVNPLRTALSTLGVVIGVAALVAVLSLGDGMERSARERIGSTTPVQAISVSSRTVEFVEGELFPLSDTLVLTEQDISSIAALPGVNWAGVGLEGRAEVVLVGGLEKSNMALVRASRGDSMPQQKVRHGRGISKSDDSASARVMVVSALLARRLASDGEDPATLVGRSVSVLDDTLSIVGVLQASNADRTGAAWLPYSTADELLKRQGRGGARPTVLARANSIEDVPAVENAIGEILALRTPEWRRRFEIGSYRARAEQAAQGILVFKLLMGAITGISLIVGGIGIMNVLLASVSERTREIGIRRATGATRRDIMLQFLSESVVISGVGSLAGMILGLSGAALLTAAIRRFAAAEFVQASFSWSSVLAAASASLLIGIVFGMYPARRAAWLKPIDAIHHE